MNRIERPATARPDAAVVDGELLARQFPAMPATGPQTPPCAGSLTRREMIRVGGLGCVPRIWQPPFFIFSASIDPEIFPTCSDAPVPLVNGGTVIRELAGT